MSCGERDCSFCNKEAAALKQEIKTPSGFTSVPELHCGFVPLKITDPKAQGLLWEYAWHQSAEHVDFAFDLQQALRDAGYEPPTRHFTLIRGHLI